MNCPRCQASVTAQDKYCPTCGLALEAARKGGAKKPPKREYEEASTQLVDVDEFRKYMAKEGEEGPLPVTPSSNATTRPAGGGTRPVQNLASPSAVGSEPLPPDVKTPDSAARSAKAPRAAGGRAKPDTADDLPEIKRPIGPQIILGGLIAVIVLFIAYMAYRAVAG